MTRPPAAPAVSTDRPFRPAPIGVKPYELELSFFTVFVLTGVYIAYEILADPSGGNPFGHALGIVGAFFMILTEIAYSLRKRTTLLDWGGPVRYWLSAHIFTGIVGPFLVLMHTGLAFRGLAGLSFFLTVIVVGSGFVGRYLYTALPRTLAGGAVSPSVMAEQLSGLQRRLQATAGSVPEMEPVISTWSDPQRMARGGRAVFGRAIWQRRYKRGVRRALQNSGLSQSTWGETEDQLLDQWRLVQQMSAVATVRAWLRLWQLLHVPLGLTLFFSIAIHIAATLYFRAGLFG